MIICPLALYMKPWQIARFTILAVGFDDQGKDIWALTMLRYSRRRGLAYCSANHCVDDDNGEDTRHSHEGASISHVCSLQSLGKTWQTDGHNGTMNCTVCVYIHQLEFDERKENVTS